MTSPSDQPESSNHIAVAVLAAGEGKRMLSDIPKHLHPVCGKPIVERVIRAGLAIEPDQLVCVVTPELVDLPRRLGMDGQFEATPQVHPYGTAGAVRSALDYLQPCDWLVSLLGDSPLLTGDTVRELVDVARATGAKVTVLTCILPDAQSYGRIERDGQGNACRIVELKNDDPARRAGPIEINSGIMVLDANWARESLAAIERSEQGEFLLTDILQVAIDRMQAGDPWPILTVVAPEEVALGVNDRAQLAAVEAEIYRSVRERLQQSGVTIVGPDTVFIDDSVIVGRDTTILPGSVISGTTTIGARCTIGPHAILHNATIGDGVHIRSSTITDSSVARGSDVGPYAHLRGGARVGPGVHVGTSAEIKGSSLGAGTRMGHFSYLGDATLGERVNIGAGTITANYDGTRKHPTEIGDDAFIGSDSVLVAPLTIGDGARTGAGSVVTRDVEPGATVVGVPARPMTIAPDNSKGANTSRG